MAQSAQSSASVGGAIHVPPNVDDQHKASESAGSANVDMDETGGIPTSKPGDWKDAAEKSALITPGSKLDPEVICQAETQFFNYGPTTPPRSAKKRDSPFSSTYGRVSLFG